MIELVRGNAQVLLVSFNLFLFFFFPEAFKPLIKEVGLTQEKASARHALFLMLLPSNLIPGKADFESDPE